MRRNWIALDRRLLERAQTAAVCPAPLPGGLRLLIYRHALDNAVEFTAADKGLGRRQCPLRVATTADALAATHDVKAIVIPLPARVLATASSLTLVQVWQDVMSRHVWRDAYLRDCRAVIELWYLDPVFPRELT